MKKRHLGAALLVAGLAAGALVWYRWRTSGFSWTELVSTLRQADWTWMALGASIMLATYIGRALRWEVMLRPLAPQADFVRIVSATCIGFTAVVLFGRAGEPVRPFLISRHEGVPFSSQIAAWLVERILDLLMILVLFGVALSQIGSSTVSPGPRLVLVLKTSGYLAGLTGLVSLAVLIGLRQFTGRVKERLTQGLGFLPQPVLSRVERFLAAFDQGMQSTRKTSFTWLIIFYTVLEWAIVIASFFCVLRAFPVTQGVGWIDVVIILGFVAFGSVLQIPGVGGGSQIATVLVLSELYGLSLEAASAIALVLWLVGFVSIVPIGLALAFREGIKFRNLRTMTQSSDLGL